MTIKQDGNYIDPTAAQDVRALARSYLQRVFRGVSPRIDNIVASTLSWERAAYQLTSAEAGLGRPLSGSRLLEVGSGLGIFLAHARVAGVTAFGIEPEAEAARMGRTVVGMNGQSGILARGTGEHLPFADAAFDAVVSFQVLEHSRDPGTMLVEMARVLRPGGILYLVVPNYCSFWEGHYGLLWLPCFAWLPRSWSKAYVSLLGRDPSFLDHLHYVSPGMLRGLLVKTAVPLNVRSWGEKLWRQRLMSGRIPGWGLTGPLQYLVALVQLLGLGSAAASIGERYGWYYPIVLVAERTE